MTILICNIHDKPPTHTGPGPAREGETVERAAVSNRISDRETGRDSQRGRETGRDSQRQREKE